MLPPGPALPGPVQIGWWLRDPLGFLDWAYRRHGPIFTLRQPGQPLVLVSGAEANRVLFTDKRLALPGEEELKTLLGDRNVLLLSGAEHRERRRILMPWFTGAMLSDWADAIGEMTRICMAAAVETAGARAMNVRDLMQEITLNVMLQITFGSHGGETRQRLRRDVSDRMLFSSRPGAVLALWLRPLQRRAWGPWRRALDAQASCDRAFFAEIAAAQARQGSEHTILNVLVHATTEDGAPLPDADIRDELMTLMVAGHENTATALCWALYWVNRDPALRARLEAEIAALGPDPDPIVLTKLPFLDAVCQETLRLYPPVMMTLTRVPQEPIPIGGHVIPAGAAIRSSIYLTHRDPAVYPDPERFLPERFLGEKAPDNKFAFMPFGGGGRRCLGANFAVFELKIILAEIIRGWSVTLPDAPVLPVRRTGLLAPDTRFAVRASARTLSPSPPSSEGDARCAA
jgi:cytochrome P450